MILAAANLVPLLGLDGGNALRGVLRLAVDNDLQATRAMKVLGPAVLVAIIGGLAYRMASQPSLPIGILLFTGVSNLINGGKFGAGREEFAALSGLSVGELMTRGVPVGPKTLLRPIVDSYLERRTSGRALGPPALPYVVMHRDGTVFGMLTDGMLAEIADARTNWKLATVWSAMEPIERVPVVTSETPASTAAVLAHESQCDGLLVVDDVGELVGCLTWDRLHTVMKSLAAR
jgi:CBS domain-containing protein